MNIEDFNKRITQGLPIRMDQTETVRGGVNLSMIDKLRHYWAQHGLPTGQEIDEHNKKVRVMRYENT